MNIVFTGRGLDSYSHPRDRTWWTDLAQGMGHDVQSKVDRTTELLVASRDNTTKALAAKARGIKVMTYYEFHQRMSGTFAPRAEPASIPSAPSPPTVDPDAPKPEDIMENWGAWA